MTLTKQEIYQRRKERLRSDPEYHERVKAQYREYHHRKKHDPEYCQKRKDYNQKNSQYFSRKMKEYNQTQPFHYAFQRLKLRARTQHILFNITEEYLQQLWTGNCAIFNTPLNLPYSTTHQDPNKATVDKIIPELGYTIGNIQWVSNKANIIKSFGSAEEHQAIVDYIHKYSIQ